MTTNAKGPLGTVAGTVRSIPPLVGAGGAHACETGQVEVDGYRINYVVEGKGQTNVMVVGSAAYYLRTFSPALREHLRIAFIDHRGFVEAPSGQTIEDVTLDKVISDIETVRKHIGWEAFVVLGHSGHGFMALEYAKRYKSHASAVVLMNVSPSYSDAERAKIDSDWDELVAPDRKAIWGEEMSRLHDRIAANPDDRFVLFMLAMGARSWRDPRFDAAGLWEGIPVNLPAIDHLWGVEFRDIDITGGLADLDRPVLLVLGRYDYLVPPARSWEPVRDRFRDLTVRVFAESGHAPMLEEAEAFDQVLLDWLGEKVAEPLQFAGGPNS